MHCCNVALGELNFKRDSRQDAARRDLVPVRIERGIDDIAILMRITHENTRLVSLRRRQTALPMDPADTSRESTASGAIPVDEWGDTPICGDFYHATALWKLLFPMKLVS